MLPMGQQMDQRKQALMKKMQGMVDARGLQGQLSRGNNVYNGGMPNAQSGGGAQFGPPVGNQNALMQQRDMQQRDMQMKQQAMAGQQGGMAAQVPQQADHNAMLQKQMQQAKSALQVAGLQTKNKTAEEGLKAAMQRRMGQMGQARSGNPKAGGMNALLKKKQSAQEAATRVRNAYTVG
jgi:hypothetical protein